VDRDKKIQEQFDGKRNNSEKLEEKRD